MDRERQHLDFPINETQRPISPGAEKHLGEVIPVLDHGFVYLVDYMGNDQSIEQAARVSRGLGTRKVSATRELIRYLYRHEHTTPFEMVEFKFHAKMPIFVARQWVRHRTANINEQSARYSILDKEFYIPEPEVIAAQSKTNRQGRGEVIDPAQAEYVRQLLFDDAMANYGHYEYMLNDDGKGNPVDPDREMIARELSRIDLTLNFYTQWYWKIDGHNLFRFLGLRKDEHAQWEIRQYADAMGVIVQDSVPLAWEAFEDYKLHAINLSKPDQQILGQILKKNNIALSANEFLDIIEAAGITNKYEKEETLEKFGKLGIVKK